jgi:hypothetical protein
MDFGYPERCAEHRTAVVKSTRQRHSLAILFLAAFVVVGGCGAVAAQQRDDGRGHSMKGYELYSWKARGDWYFSLVVGTNRQKSFQEISSPRVRINGVAALKTKLDRLPRGEELFWSLHRMPKTTFPPRHIVNEIIGYCRGRHLQLSVR